MVKTTLTNLVMNKHFCHAAHTDTMVTSIRAYVNALNKLIIRREKSAPEPMQQAG